MNDNTPLNPSIEINLQGIIETITTPANLMYVTPNGQQGIENLAQNIAILCGASAVGTGAEGGSASSNLVEKQSNPTIGRSG